MWCLIVSIPDLCPLSYLAKIKRILGECLLVFSFQVKALKMLVDIPRLVVSSVSLSLSHWYPGSGVVLDCIDS